MSRRKERDERACNESRSAGRASAGMRSMVSMNGVVSYRRDGERTGRTRRVDATRRDGSDGAETRSVGERGRENTLHVCASEPDASGGFSKPRARRSDVCH